MVQNPLLILGLIEMEFIVLDAGPEIGPCALSIWMFVESTQVSRYAGVQSADDFV